MAFSGLWGRSEGRGELSEHGADGDSTLTASHPDSQWGGSPIPGQSSRASMLFLSLVMAFLKMKCTSETCFLLSCVKNLHVLLNFSK